MDGLLLLSVEDEGGHSFVVPRLALLYHAEGIASELLGALGDS